MQRYKREFRDPNHRGTIGNVQRCLRLDDLDEIHDGRHRLSFDMLGMFSFRELTVQDTIRLWVTWLGRVGVVPTHVTVHPDRRDWERWWEPFGFEPRLDPGCTWSDGDDVGYCTELYVGDSEIGNIVNPNGDCIDVGFGLDRLGGVLGDPPPGPDDVLREAVIRLLDSGYRPGNKRQGYVLRRLLRRMVHDGIGLDHPVYREEIERQRRVQQRYHHLVRHHPGQPPEWWWETHGIDVGEVEAT